MKGCTCCERTKCKLPERPVRLTRALIRVSGRVAYLLADLSQQLVRVDSCFTPTETVQTVRDGDGHLDSYTAAVSSALVSKHGA